MADIITPSAAQTSKPSSSGAPTPTLSLREKGGAPAAGPGRLVSLDIFRGATIAGMILVNNPGTWDAIYWPLEHAEWHGWTPTDLIFPFFLFIVGVSMVLSFAARRQRGATRGALLRHAMQRSAIIFAIGFLLAFWPKFDLHTVRIAGVLQRIAVVYLVASAIVLFSGWRGRLAAAVGLLVGYWLLMTQVPGFDLTPDGNLAAWLDRRVMYNHLWVAHHWDPEGLLSTLPAVVSTLIGVFTGEWLRMERPHPVSPKAGETRVGHPGKVPGMMLAGVVGLAVGRLWGVWFPINKNLWTSSYVLFTGGFALVLLALCYWAVEMRGWRRWGAPFLWYGSNAITVYAASSWLGKYSVTHYIERAGQRMTLKAWVYQGAFAPVARPVNASLWFASAYVLTFLVLAWIMYRNKIFIKI